MAKPSLKTDYVAHPSQEAVASCQATAPVTRPRVADGSQAAILPSPVQDLHSSLERAFGTQEMARSEIRRGPFAVALFGMVAFSALFWAAVVALLHAL